jgi:hypothetical protein
MKIKKATAKLIAVAFSFFLRHCVTNRSEVKKTERLIMKRSFLVMAICLFGFANVSVASPVDNVEKEVVMTSCMDSSSLSGFTGGFTGGVVASLIFTAVLVNDYGNAAPLKKIVSSALVLGLVGGIAGVVNNFLWSRILRSPKLVDKVKEEK